MVFSTNLFLLYFFPIFFAIYFFSAKGLKNYVALAGSLFFYMWGAPKFVLVLVIAILVDFFLAKKIHVSEGRERKRWLLSSIVLNVSLLGYFKYANFFVDNVNDAIQSLGFQEVSWTNVALPIGISFFTFQKMSYLIDVYRKAKEPLSNVADYALYVVLFPQLIAGPIVRFNELADEIKNRDHNENIDNRLIGLIRFIIGLSKKVLIANVMGAEADRIFNSDLSLLNSGQAWLGALAYTFQIYFDFSGYSDMAIGLGRMMGFTFPENFNNPYTSRSITEFWRRWHMTLSRWMRDYLYIPLGGNKVSTTRLYINLWVVFLISGLWHGAAWNFVVWGIYHGLFLVLDRLFLEKWLKRIGKYPAVLVTFVLTIIGWIFFRVESLDEAFFFIKQLFAFDFTGLEFQVELKFKVILAIAFFFSFFALARGVEDWQERIFNPRNNVVFRTTIGLGLVSIALFLLCLGEVTVSGFNPFIYFRF